MNMIERIKQTSGMNLIISALQKHRVITMIYVSLSLIFFILLLFLSPSPSRVFSSIFNLLWPIGIALTFFLSKEKGIKIIRYILAADVIGWFFFSVMKLFYKILFMIWSPFPHDNMIRLQTFFSMTNLIISLCIATLFLLVIVFNIHSRIVGKLIISFKISQIVFPIIFFIIILSRTGIMPNFNFLLTIPKDISFQMIIRYSQYGVGTLAAVFRDIIMFIIAWNVVKTKQSTEDATVKLSNENSNSDTA